MLIVSIVHHGHSPLLSVFDAWSFLLIKKASLVPIEFTNQKQKRKQYQLVVTKKQTKKKTVINSGYSED